MKSRSRKQLKENPKVEAGSLLLAQPFWKEEIYQHSVIMIIDHNSDGATGIILNKSSNLIIHDALPDLDIQASLCFGGPMDVNMVSYLHKNSDIPEAQYIGNNLFLGGDYEFIRELINNRRFDLKDVKFYAGFVRWSPGQVEHEIEENKWWITEVNSQELFGVSMDELWSFKVFTCGHIYGLFSDLPDPSLN